MAYSVGKALLGSDAAKQSSPCHINPIKSDTTCSVGVSCALVAQVDSMDTMPEMIYEKHKQLPLLAHSGIMCISQPSRKASYVMVCSLRTKYGSPCSLHST